VNGYARFMAALRREEPDAVPVWELLINSPVIERLRPGASYADFAEWMDLDGVTCGEDWKSEPVDDGGIKDEWGIVWRVAEPGVTYPCGGPIETEEDLDSIEPPDPEAPWRLKTLESLVKRFKGERAIVFLGHDSFEFSHYLVGGMVNLFKLYVKNPRFAKRISQMVLEYKIRVMERAARSGADVLLTGDDYANKTGPLMSPAQLREFVLPYMAKAVETSHRLGLPFIKHTDGNIWRIVDMLVDSGIDGLDPLEPVARMDIGEVKRAYGDRICVVGNVDCSHLLQFGTVEDVTEAVKETIAKGSPGGGHILASSNSIHPGVNPDNYVAMVRAARKYGKYPIDRELIREYAGRDYAANLR